MFLYSYSIPFLGLLESGWRVSGDEKQGPHWMHAAQSWRRGKRRGKEMITLSSGNPQPFTQPKSLDTCLTTEWAGYNMDVT